MYKMKTPFKLRLILLSMCALLSACASTTFKSYASEPTSSFIDQFSNEEQECRSIDSLYINEGEQHDSFTGDPKVVYLSELMFSRLKDGRLPSFVRIVTNTQESQLLVTLLGATNRKLRYTIDCQSGWHVLKKSRNGQYLGEGVIEKHYGQISFFRVDENGDLILRVSIDAEFNSMYIFNRNIKTEEWYRFKQLSD